MHLAEVAFCTHLKNVYCSVMHARVKIKRVLKYAERIVRSASCRATLASATVVEACRRTRQAQMELEPVHGTSGCGTLNVPRWDGEPM